MTILDNGSLSCLTNFDQATEYRPIAGYETRYAVSREGQVKSLLTGLPLRPGKTSKGYLSVTLYDGSKPKAARSFSVHRLVAEAWIGPCPEGQQVNHVNAVKTDNRAENLEYCTPKENQRHAEYNGLAKRRYGAESPNAKLRDDDVIQIKAMLALGIQKACIARAFRVDPKLIQLITNGVSWAHVPDVKVTVEHVA